MSWEMHDIDDISSAVVRLPRSIYFRDVPTSLIQIDMMSMDSFHDMILLQTLLSLLSGERVLLNRVTQ